MGRSCENSTDVHRSTLNATQSPLLRLPAELRTKIWELLYSDIIINTYMGDHPEIKYIPVACPDRPCLVSKQFWAETSHIFLSTCTFRFYAARTFHHFALSQNITVARIRKIWIRCFLGHLDNRINCSKRWAQALASVLGRFRGLEGVHLYFLIDYDDIASWDGRDIMNHANRSSKATKLSAIIRSFQQHNLMGGLTTVKVVGLGAAIYAATSSALSVTIRSHLLDHHPRRVSQPATNKSQ